MKNEMLDKLSFAFLIRLSIFGKGTLLETNLHGRTAYFEQNFNFLSIREENSRICKQCRS